MPARACAPLTVVALAACATVLACGKKPAPEPAPAATTFTVTATATETSIVVAPAADAATAPADAAAVAASDAAAVPADAVAAAPTPAAQVADPDAKKLGRWSKVKDAPWREGAAPLPRTDPRTPLCEAMFPRDVCGDGNCDCWIAAEVVLGGAPPLLGAAIVGAVQRVDRAAAEPQSESWGLMLDLGDRWVPGALATAFHEDKIGFYHASRITAFTRLERAGQPMIRLDMEESADDYADEGERVSTIALTHLCGVDGFKPACTTLYTSIATGTRLDAQSVTWKRALSLADDGRIVLGKVEGAAPGLEGAPQDLTATLPELAAKTDVPGDGFGDRDGDEPATAPLEPAHPLYPVCLEAARRAKAVDTEWQCRFDRAVRGGAGALSEVALLRFSTFGALPSDRRVLAFKDQLGWTLGPAITDTSTLDAAEDAVSRVHLMRMRTSLARPFVELRFGMMRQRDDKADNAVVADRLEALVVCAEVETKAACGLAPTLLVHEVARLAPDGDAPKKYGPLGTSRWAQPLTLGDDGTIVRGATESVGMTSPPSDLPERMSLEALIAKVPLR